MFVLSDFLFHSFNNRIASAIPNHWEIGDKTGTCQYGTTNDVAIIWPDDSRALVMSIFYTQSEKNAKAKDKILQQVAKYYSRN